MARRKTHLPAPARTFLATGERRWSKQDVLGLHRWMNERNLVLADLTAAHIEHFWQHEQCEGLAPSTMHSRRCRVHQYLFWLCEHGHLRFVVEPPRLRHMSAPLPGPARRFLKLRGNQRYAPMVRNLHDWMHRKRVALGELTDAHIKAFVRRPIGLELVNNSRESLLYRIEPYLLWLYDRGLVGFRFDRQVRRLFALPKSALGFVDILRPVLKRSTCGGYLSALRGFHSWLDSSKLDIERFDRAAAERWLKSLADRGLAPCTRNAHIFHARRYLYWLAERGAIAADPDDLLRIEDLPKIPSYLPRPFPVEVDHQLQRRFVASGTLYGQALFVMRRSGVRIGELVRLEPGCLQRDLRDNAFVKVPLGKLDNERLVPLDDQTRDVLVSLQQKCPRGSEFLLMPELSRQKLREQLSAELKQAAAGLDIPGAVVSHRLRHTYATELLNAGLPLVTIMKLLGHRSFRMTMRYAAIAQQTIVDDYHQAMAVIAHKYDTAETAICSTGETTPERQALDLISILRKTYDSSAESKRRVQAIIKRIYRIRDDILALAQSTRNP